MQSVVIFKVDNLERRALTEARQLRAQSLHRCAKRHVRRARHFVGTETSGQIIRVMNNKVPTSAWNIFLSAGSLSLFGTIPLQAVLRIFPHCS